MTTFNLHAEPAQESWLDNYGYLNEAFYVVPFSNASRAFQGHTGRSLFARLTMA